MPDWARGVCRVIDSVADAAVLILLVLVVLGLIG